MAASIAVRNGALIPIYEVLIQRDTPPSYIHIGGPQLDAQNSASLIVIIDWSDVACFSIQPYCDAQYPSWIVADLAWDTLYSDATPEQQITKKLLTQTPVHLIGHSRGAGVVSRLAHTLGQLGIWLDQLTYLDPHPVAAAGDFPAVAWANVVYAEDYWQTLDTLIQGEDVAGAYDPNLSSILDCPIADTYCLTPFLHHNDVHRYYHGTIDLGTSSDWETVDSEPSGDILSRWYQDGGFVARSQTGYFFSRAGQAQGFPGSRPSQGIHRGFPGGPSLAAADNRVPVELAQPAVAYPNVLLLAPEPLVARPGQTLRVPYITQGLESQYRLTLQLDDDTNPYNGAGACDTAAIDKGVFDPGVSWDTVNECDAGNACADFLVPQTSAPVCYIRATVENVDNSGPVRYDYSSSPIAIGQPVPVALGTSLIVASNYGINQDYSQDLGVDGATTLEVTATGTLSPGPSTSCGGGDVGDYIEITGQAGQVIRQFTGHFNEVFSVSGPFIHVHFHSNCVTLSDGLTGPASVTVASTSSPATSFSVPTNYRLSSDYAQTLFIPGVQYLTVSTSGNLSPAPSANCPAGDVGDYIEITDQNGQVIRQLSGTWNSTFGAAGSQITVRFHSNCFFASDGLDGPVSVSIAATAQPPTSFDASALYRLSSDYAQTLFIPGVQYLTVSTSGNLSPAPSANCPAGDVGDYIEITDQNGQVIRQLSGTWNSTFGAAGSQITVRFHSNCFFASDGLDGPVSVSIAATAQPPTSFDASALYRLSSDYAQTLFIPGVQYLTVSTSGNLSPAPSANCPAGDVGDYIEITDQNGQVIRQLSGTWNSTFGAAGSQITVRFHSNCFFASDGLDGPVILAVSSAASGAPDTTPNTFSFQPIVNADPSSILNSNAIVVAGIDAPTQIGVSNGFFRIDGGPLAVMPETIYPGDNVTAVGVAPPWGGETSYTQITIGGVVETFAITTSVTVPDVPTAPTAVAGNGTAIVQFTPPAHDGGAPVTGYVVSSNPAGALDSDAGSTSTSHVLTGLTNGTSYSFTVTAANVVGTSPPSIPTNQVTPTAPVSALKLSGVVWVAKSGGDYSSIQSAIDAMAPLASATNPILVKVAPGVFTERVTLGDYVDVEGSGSGQTTVVDGSPYGTVVTGARAEMRNLTIINTRNSSNPGANAIYQVGNTPSGATRLRNVTLITSGYGDNLAVFVAGGSLTLIDSQVSAALNGSQSALQTALYASGPTSSIVFMNGQLTPDAGTPPYFAYQTNGASISVVSSRVSGNVFGTVKCLWTFDALFTPVTCP